MKEYNRTTKRWEEKNTEQVGDLKKRELCRGGRPHNPVLVLPSFGVKCENPTEEVVERYYRIEQARYDSNKMFDDNLKSNGLINSRWRGMSDSVTRYYECSVCRKKESK